MNFDERMKQEDIDIELLRKEKAKLEKSNHEWKHGDVFKNNVGVNMVYISTSKYEETFCLGGCDGSHGKNYLNTGKFLFNINDKL